MRQGLGRRKRRDGAARIGAGLAAALALALAAAGCQPATQPATGSESLDCLLGPDTGRPECESLDDEPERCIQAGGLFDTATGRCIR